MEMIKGDLKCNRCGDDYFSKNATKDMNEHNLCFNCITEHKRKFNDMSLK
jgi:formylmethanofuran dehydrogenase subunit E